MLKIYVKHHNKFQALKMRGLYKGSCTYYVITFWGPERPLNTGQVGATTTCSQNKHEGEFLYFKLPKLPIQVKSRHIKDVTKYVLNTDVQFTN